jgi:hypothetical protein
VTKGDLLIERQGPESVLERTDKMSVLKVAELRSVQFRRQSELSLSAAETKNANGLRRQITELDEQLAGS